MDTNTTKNLLLRSLPIALLRNILDESEFVHLDLRESLIEPNKPINFVDFPETGVMSIFQPMANGSLVEIANIGNEGMIGVTVALGVSTIGESAYCQVEGSAWRIETTRFTALLNQYPELSLLCQRYAVTLLDQVSRNTGCNRSHSIEERCARRFLLTNDRCHNNAFVLTQEFLSTMLGVSRSGVNLAAGILSKDQLITYVRGKVAILDRKGLESASCGCYGAMNRYFQQTMNFSS